MRRQPYCSNCGIRLTITKRALPKFSTVIDIVEYHTCPSQKVPFDLSPNPSPAYLPQTDKRKFVEELDEIEPLGINELNEKIIELRDRRPDSQVKTTAPPGILRHLKGD